MNVFLEVKLDNMPNAVKIQIVDRHSRQFCNYYSIRIEFIKTNQITVSGHHRPASDTPFKSRATSLLASQFTGKLTYRSVNLKSDCFISTSVCLLAKY